jgi:hypothetical protein
MLGNKFLDDNTYTNKTWAEVSCIRVEEVHIMEVEFLSNMQYCLATSESQWKQWQSLLGKFTAFYSRASRPQLLNTPGLVLGSTMLLPRPLPSPPASNNASPPSVSSTSLCPALGYAPLSVYGPTPAHSPLGSTDDINASAAPNRSRKRSLEEFAHEHPAKRHTAGVLKYTSPQRHYNPNAAYASVQPVPRLALPVPQSTICTAPLPTHQVQQYLPPLSMASRATATAVPATSHYSQPTALPIVAASFNQPPLGSNVQAQNKFHNPLLSGTSAASPSTSISTSSTVMHPTTQVSPSYFLRQRTSPYRPIHRVSTLLHPPPSAALQGRPNNVDLHRMQYQPLGKPVQHTGRLPYLAQNQWLDGAHPQQMTPVHQWPGFSNVQPAYTKKQ